MLPRSSKLKNSKGKKKTRRLFNKDRGKGKRKERKNVIGLVLIKTRK